MINNLICLKKLARLVWLPAFCCGLLVSSNASAQNPQANKIASNTSTGGSAQTASTQSAKPKQQKPKKSTKKVVTKVVDTAKTEATPIDEMIVMGMASQANPGEATSKIAHPKIGWANFETYLRDGATSPDKKTGLVKVSFYVHDDGSCTDFKVVNSLSKVADQSAIKLIKNGPSWIGSADGEAKATTVTVNFK